MTEVKNLKWAARIRNSSMGKTAMAAIPRAVIRGRVDSSEVVDVNLTEQPSKDAGHWVSHLIDHPAGLS